MTFAEYPTNTTVSSFVIAFAIHELFSDTITSIQDMLHVCN